jgi:hypothetical protein
MGEARLHPAPKTSTRHQLRVLKVVIQLRRTPVRQPVPPRELPLRLAVLSRELGCGLNPAVQRRSRAPHRSHSLSIDLNRDLRRHQGPRRNRDRNHDRFRSRTTSRSRPIGLRRDLSHSLSPDRHRSPLAQNHALSPSRGLLPNPHLVRRPNPDHNRSPDPHRRRGRSRIPRPPPNSSLIRTTSRTINTRSKFSDESSCSLRPPHGAGEQLPQPKRAFQLAGDQKLLTTPMIRIVQQRQNSLVPRSSCFQIENRRFQRKPESVADTKRFGGRGEAHLSSSCS